MRTLLNKVDWRSALSMLVVAALILSFQNCSAFKADPSLARMSSSIQASELDEDNNNQNENPDGIEQPATQLWYEPTFASSFTNQNLKNLIRSDLLRYQNFEGLGNISTTSYVVPVFGRNKQTRLNFLSDRVKIFEGIPEGANPSDYENILAANIGAMSFLAREAWLQVGRTDVAATLSDYQDPRNGVILAPQYHLLGPMGRISTLVHEARHSDCTGGVKTSLVNSYIRANISGAQPNAPYTSACLHLHNACPAGHDLEGISACDTHLWGAYAIGAMFSLLVDTKCENCTDEEKAEAALDSQDQFDRVLRFDEITDRENPAPYPDMNHSLIREEDEAPIRSAN